MLQTLISPNNRQFSRKPLILRVQAQDGSGVPYGEKPVRAVIHADDYEWFHTDSVTVLIAFEDTTYIAVQFDVIANPTLSDAQIYDAYEYLNTYTVNKTLADYYNHVAERIANHPLLSPYIRANSVDLGGNLYDINIFAKDYDNIQNIVLTPQISGGNVTAQTFAKTPNLAPENYAVTLEIFVEKTYKSGNFVKVASSLHQSPDENYIYAFDLSETVHSAINDFLNDLPVPAMQSLGAYDGNNIRRYYYRIGEKAGVPAAQLNWSALEIKSVWRGGDSMETTLDYFTNLSVNKAIVTNKRSRRVTYIEPQYITCVNTTSNPVSMMLEIKQYNSSGTLTSTSYFGATTFERLIEPLDTQLMPCGASVLGINAQTKKYTVRVIDRTVYNNTAPTPTITALSELITFYVLDMDQEDTRYLHYHNAYGAIETLRCTGRYEISTDIQRQKIVSYGQNESYYGLTRQSDESIERVYTYRTGFMTQEEARVLDELFIPGTAWDVSEEYICGLDMLTDKFKIYETWQNMNAYELQFRLRRKERNYRNDNALDSGIGGWFNPSDGFWVDNNGAVWQIP